MLARFHCPSHATVVAYLALFVALGGGAYAASSLRKGSVGTKQLKNGAVTTSKLKDGAVTTSKLGNGTVTASKINPSGLTVPNALHAADADSAANAANATDATNAGHASAADNASSLGGASASSFVQFGATLPSGLSETGVWAVAAGDSTSGFAGTGLRFDPPLDAGLDGGHVIFTTSSATHCSGLGHADPGYLCVYQQTGTGMTFNSITPGDGSFGASSTGAVVFLNVTAAGSFAQGHWTVTAP